MEVEKENQNGNEMEINENEKESKVEITEVIEQKDETKDLVGHGGQGKELSVDDERILNPNVDSSTRTIA